VSLEAVVNDVLHELNAYGLPWLREKVHGSALG
jgi:hypothetical protein